MKKNKKNNDRWQGYTPADCDCKYCVYYGGKKNGNVPQTFEYAVITKGKEVTAYV